MTKKRKTKAEELMDFVIRESKGPMDTPWGYQLRKIEKRVAPLKDDPHNADALQARWESGLKLVEHYDDGKLPDGHLKEIAAGLGTTQKELKERLNLAIDKAVDKKPKSTDGMKPKSWRDVLPIHPVAEAFPLITPEELQKTCRHHQEGRSALRRHRVV